MVNDKQSKLRVVSHSFTGPAQYHHAGGNDTVTVPGIKGIRTIDDVQMWCPGLIVEPISVAGPIVSYLVKGAGSAHTHTLSFKNGKGTKAVTAGADAFGNATADYNINYSAAGGGLVTNSGPASVADNQAIVLANDTVLNALTIYMTVVGY